MTRRIWKRAVVGALLAIAGASMLYAQQPAPDVVLFNGKIITVDDRFSIAEAVAVRGERIAAVGTNQDITRLAGPNTRRIDLRGRAVVPGMIDNHAHFMEEGVLWSVELRLDGIETRKQAIEMVRAKAKSLAPGEWVYTLGGWSPDQFTDDKRSFTREELDTIAPNHSVLLQFTRAETYLNSRAIEAIGGKQRPETLIAHTRKNAFLILQESNLGSIQPGKLADLVALDRDYLTIPADQIKAIRPTMTMVGGRVVYDAATPSTR